MSEWHGPMSKTCPRCEATKPHTLFYRSTSRPDGMQSECKACQRERNRDRARRNRKPERMTPERRAKKREAMRRYRAANANKVRARKAVRTEVRAGRLIPAEACEICGESPAPLADGRSGLRADHHNGYDKPHWLDVRWVCVRCDGLSLRRG